MKKSSSNSQDMRAYNRILIRNSIRKFGPIARNQLAQATGMTPASVTIIVNEMMEDGIVLEVGYGKSKGGRKPVMLELNPNAAHLLAVTIQRSEVVVALFDITGNIVGQEKSQLDTTNPSDVLKAIGEHYEKVLKTSGVKKGRVRYCGVASPGIINAPEGIIMNSSNIGWKNTPFAKMLEERLQGLPVLLENISNAAALAERDYGSGQGYGNLIYLNLSVGIGMGIIINNELYGGTKGYAGEIGHFAVSLEQSSKSSLESVCGTRKIIERIKAEVPNEIFLANNLIKEKLSTEDFLSPALLETKEVQKVLADVAEQIGFVVANLVSIFNPELIILGGELAKAGKLFTKQVSEEVEKYLLVEFISTFQIVSSNMKADPPLFGAYALALDKLFSIEKWY